MKQIVWAFFMMGVLNNNIQETLPTQTQPSLRQNLEEFLHDEAEENLKNFDSQQWLDETLDKVIDVHYIEETVVVNLHMQMLNYGGGSAMEIELARKIMEVVFENTMAQKITILVDGQVVIFPEGSNFKEVTRQTYEKYYKEEEV
ncbi:MAG: hypothetical protein ATN36_04565 [Epulopiscium sp. Nele67-Bin005]|nr:MAG: hypothetical protein ATN36_04565 [Epulopiscium sp. Nele67-Bin005]